MTNAYGWMLAAALAVIGVWRELQHRSVARRLDAIEGGVLYREMQQFVADANKSVRKSRDEMVGLRREMDSMAAKLHESEARLGRALLECAQAEERVARLLNAGMPSGEAP